jgi:hypothetical protein
MRAFKRLVTVGCVALISAGIFEPAVAGDGGEDFSGLQNFINVVCGFLSMSSCPQTPTITQAVLQTAAFINASPAAVRADPAIGNIPPGVAVDAVNSSRPPGQTPIIVNAGGKLPVDPAVLTTLQPLAFANATNGRGTATPTQLYDPSADTFFYAVGGLSAANTGSPQPDTLVLFYDVPGRTNKVFAPDQVVAEASLPLTVLNKDGTERAVPAVLQFKSPGPGGTPCSASTVVGDFAGIGLQQMQSPATIGINCAVIFAASPVSPRAHAVFEISVPMLITGACAPNPCPPSPNTDAAYFVGISLGFDPFSPSLTLPFVSDDVGFPSVSAVLGASGQSIGIAPTAAPLGPPVGCSQNKGVTTCTPPATYPLCANLPRDASGHNLVPSVAAFYSIATHGEVLLASPLQPAPPGIVCPLL